MVYTRNEVIFSCKREDVLKPATTGMDLEDTLLREISQTQRDTSCVTLLTGSTQKSPIHRDRK